VFTTVQYSTCTLKGKCSFLHFAHISYLKNVLYVNVCEFYLKTVNVYSSEKSKEGKNAHSTKTKQIKGRKINLFFAKLFAKILYTTILFLQIEGNVDVCDAFMLLVVMKYLKNGIETKKTKTLVFAKICVGQKELIATSAKFFVSIAIFSLERNFLKFRGKWKRALLSQLYVSLTLRRP
jgi:hypothetical protein